MPNTTSSRERLSLDFGWQFHLGDIPFPKLISHSDCYSNAKAARAGGAAAPGYDDTVWPVVNVPHDWASESPYVAEECLSQGYRPRGIGWYRRHFRLDPGDRGRHLELQFDGIATHCNVWVNGSIVHRNWCGYTGFSIDITPFAKYGDELNTIAIRVDADAMEGWWYEGAGIYRHTWLVKRNATHLVTDGVWANPLRDVAGTWALPVELTAANISAVTEAVELAVTLIDPDGRVVAVSSSNAIDLPSLEEITTNLTLSIDSPQLWSCDKPTLYTVRTELIRDGSTVDSVTTTCGFRTLRFDANKGFFLNEQPLKLKGVCNHQDHAGVGVAIPDALWEWRLRQLKTMGVNAYRVAHNPPSIEFLDLCDRIGILVMDENRHFNSSPEYVRQLEWLMRRDRNHPSVFLWSVFNEEPMQGSEVGYEMVRRMVAIVKRLDPTRPVTAAMNGGLFSPVNVSQAVDVVGFNYQIEFYDRFHEANPAMCLTSSEDTSAFMTRGAYETVVGKNIRGSYDTEFAPWGASHRDAWRAVAERDYLAGGFVWTGFDYHGEPTPHSWPSCGSFFGCMDLCGFPKAAFHIHRAHWVENEPVLELIPHWNWPGREGQPVNVMAITNAARVALSLNGKSLGEKVVDRFDFASWEVPYSPGLLEAVAFDEAGKEIARATVETTGEIAALELVPDRPALDGDGWDAQPITVRALDAQGRPVPTANLVAEFEIEGPGAIIGLGNGDPNCHEPEKGNRRSLFNGLAQVIVQTAADSSGEIVLRAAADGLKFAELRIAVNAVCARPAMPAARPVLFLQSWRMSPLSNERIDPNLVVADNDMNTWPSAQPGELQSFAGGTFALYRLTFQPFASIQKNGGHLVFREITGEAEIWLDGACIGRKPDFAATPLSIPISPATGLRTLTILIMTTPGSPAGLSGSVCLL
ncbi:MAG: beta-galactosidase GalA [Luteolibacter sp.]